MKGITFSEVLPRDAILFWIWDTDLQFPGGSVGDSEALDSPAWDSAAFAVPPSSGSVVACHITQATVRHDTTQGEYVV